MICSEEHALAEEICELCAGSSFPRKGNRWSGAVGVRERRVPFHLAGG